MSCLGWRRPWGPSSPAARAPAGGALWWWGAGGDWASGAGAARGRRPAAPEPPLPSPPWTTAPGRRGRPGPETQPAPRAELAAAHLTERQNEGERETRDERQKTTEDPFILFTKTGCIFCGKIVWCRVSDTAVTWPYQNNHEKTCFLATENSVWKTLSLRMENFQEFILIQFW